jgi:glutamate carboxypeptidase
MMLNTLISWVNTNSHSSHLEGIEKMRALLKDSFSRLNGDIEEISLPPYKKITSRGVFEEVEVGKALRITKRREAPFQVFLGGHMDTVYTKEDPFQKARFENETLLIGPGAADMKGGLLVMLEALLKFEKHPLSQKIGWEIFINTDEEIGSPSSRFYFEKVAKQFEVALLFEPGFPDGAIAEKRKGSLNIYAIAHGKTAHVGRDFEKGKNAIGIICNFATEIQKLLSLEKGIQLNLGSIQGGGPLNVIPDLAILGLNGRVETLEELNLLKEAFNRFTSHELSFFEVSIRPPKGSNHFFELLKKVASQIGEPLILRETGGTCDGNLLESFGLPSIDALGPIGGHLHTEHEYLDITSLEKRINLTTHLLMELAQGAL